MPHPLLGSSPLPPAYDSGNVALSTQAAGTGNNTTIRSGRVGPENTATCPQTGQLIERDPGAGIPVEDGSALDTSTLLSSGTVSSFALQHLQQERPSGLLSSTGRNK